MSSSSSESRGSLGRVAFIGLGAMGVPMARNMMQWKQGFTVVGYDINQAAVQLFVDAGGEGASSAAEAVSKADFVVTMVPNDKVLRSVCLEGASAILDHMPANCIHISCSTINPATARELAQLHKARGIGYVGAPVFARADGIATRAASFVVGGADADVDRASQVLEATAVNVFRFGGDPGAGNVVKLCGNFMIAAAIESCAEALSLAEKNGLDRAEVMNMLNSTIFDCLIYKGYGNRVASRQHVPGQPMVGPGFALDLGAKDVQLTLDVAGSVGAPMPFASALRDQFVSGMAKGRSKMDWSAIALGVSEQAGVDVSQHVPK